MPTIPFNRMMKNSAVPSGDPQGSTPRITARFKAPDLESRGRILAKGIRDLGSGIASGISAAAKGDDKSDADAMYNFQSDRIAEQAKFDQEETQAKQDLIDGKITPDQYTQRLTGSYDQRMKSLAERHGSKLSGEHKGRADAQLQQGRASVFGRAQATQQKVVEDRKVADLEQKAQLMIGKIKQDPSTLRNNVAEAEELINNAPISEREKNRMRSQLLSQMEEAHIEARLKKKDADYRAIIRDIDRMPVTDSGLGKQTSPTPGQSSGQQAGQNSTGTAGNTGQNAGQTSGKNAGNTPGAPVIQAWPKQISVNGRTINVPAVRARPTRRGGAQSIKGIVFHHTEGKSNEAGFVSHINQTGRGYNYYIFEENGQAAVKQLIPDEQYTAHVKGSKFVGKSAALRSETSLGIAMVLNPGQQPSQAMREAAWKLASIKAREYGVDVRNIIGHGGNFSNRSGRMKLEGRFAQELIEKRGLWKGDDSTTQGSASATTKETGATQTVGPDDVDQANAQRIAQLKEQRDNLNYAIEIAAKSGDQAKEAKLREEAARLTGDIDDLSAGKKNVNQVEGDLKDKNEHIPPVIESTEGMTNADALVELAKKREELQNEEGADNEDEIARVDAEVKRISAAADMDKPYKAKVESNKQDPNGPELVRAPRQPAKYRHLSLARRRNLVERIKQNMRTPIKNQAGAAERALRRGMEIPTRPDGTTVLDDAREFLPPREAGAVERRLRIAEFYGKWAKDLQTMSHQEVANLLDRINSGKPDGVEGMNDKDKAAAENAYAIAEKEVRHQWRQIQAKRNRDPAGAVEDIPEMKEYRKDLEGEVQQMAKAFGDRQGNDPKQIAQMRHVLHGKIIRKRMAIARKIFGANRNVPVIPVLEAMQLGNFKAARVMTPDQYEKTLNQVAVEAHRKYGPKHAQDVVRSWIGYANVRRNELRDVQADTMGPFDSGTAEALPRSSIDASVPAKSQRQIQLEIQKDQKLQQWLMGKPGENLVRPDNIYSGIVDERSEAPTPPRPVPARSPLEGLAR